MLALLEANRKTPSVSYDEKKRAYLSSDGTSFGGLVPTLRKAFYSAYDYSLSLVAAAAAPSSNSRGMTGVPSPLLMTGKPSVHRHPSVMRNRDVGLNRGVRIDEELNIVCSAITRLKITLAQYMSALSRRRRAASPSHTSLHSYTLAVLRRLRVLGLEPIQCQLSVSSLKSKKATKIDMLCWDRSDSCYVVIEVKNGFTKYNLKGSGSRMTGGLSRHTDCPRNQHHLQLLGGMVFVSYTFGIDFKRVKGVLIRVDEYGAHSESLQAWCLDPAVLKLVAAVVIGC